MRSHKPIILFANYVSKQTEETQGDGAYVLTSNASSIKRMKLGNLVRNLLSTNRNEPHVPTRHPPSCQPRECHVCGHPEKQPAMKY